jgi:hypothetical protein
MFCLALVDPMLFGLKNCEQCLDLDLVVDTSGI